MPLIEARDQALQQCLVIAVDDAAQRQVLLAVAAAHGLGAVAIEPERRIEDALAELVYSEQNRLWIVDLARLHREALLPAQLIVLMRRVHPGAWLLFSHAAQVAVNRWLLSWARNRGALGLVPGLSPDRPAAIESCLKPAIEQLGLTWRPPAAPAGEATYAPERAREQRALSELESRGMSLDSLAAWATGAVGFPLRDAVWRGTTYRRSFVGREAVSALAAHLDIDRAAAVVLGELLRRSRLFFHVKQEHAFEDDELFYRFTPITEKLERLSLAHLLSDATGRGGFELRDRLYLAKTYPRCLFGAEAVEWMQRRYALSEDEALFAGQAMMDLGVLAHVAGEHEFENAALFYEWRGFARAMVPAE
jgi:hypothetical protein